MKKVVITLIVLLALDATAATTNNTSCDIAVLPAATLLLPYFEVDLTSPQTSARTTLFTIVNTSRYPQIARVTIWSDLAYPLMTFNIFLTGYDVQAINLYDILGPTPTIAPPSGTTSSTTPGDRSLPNNSNPNFAPSASNDCLINPGAIPVPLANDIRSALMIGKIPACGAARVGLVHFYAVGYITIDVVKTCGSAFPTSTAYYDDLLYDNVLTGDYEIINPDPVTGNYAGGNPLVHIRAIPEGGAGGVVVPTTLPFTFYDRYTPAASRAIDRRQPLPSTFAARFIQGGPTAFSTEFHIWREGVTGGNAACTDYATNFGDKTAAADVVRFDEHENPSALTCPPILCAPPVLNLPPSSTTRSDNGSYPPMVSNDVGGWMFLSLSNTGTSAAYSQHRRSQNWVDISMFAEGRFSVNYDATMLANGCTP